MIIRTLLRSSLSLEQKNDAPRNSFTTSWHHSAIDCASVDFPVPARPLIHKMDLSEGMSARIGVSVESPQSSPHTRLIQEYTEARSSTRVDGAQSFRPRLVSNLASPANRRPGITSEDDSLIRGWSTRSSVTHLRSAPGLHCLPLA